MPPHRHVRNEVSPEQDVRWEEIDYQVVIEEKFSGTLEGLEELSHIIVLFWLHRKREDLPPLKIRLEVREDMPLVGAWLLGLPCGPTL